MKLLVNDPPCMGVKMEGPLLFSMQQFADERGFFCEKYNKTEISSHIDVDFIQDNFSVSYKNVIRGLHYQTGQAKLVSCVQGMVLDVIVDIREGSTTYGQWAGYMLDENTETLFIPAGFAHGFCCLTETCSFFYKVNTHWNKELEGGFHFNEFGIKWPISEKDAILSEKDKLLPKFGEV